jgi:hypothetical protein
VYVVLFFLSTHHIYGIQGEKSGEHADWIVVDRGKREKEGTSSIEEGISIGKKRREETLI